MELLYNTKSRKELIHHLKNEPFRRITLSFYRYVHIADPVALRDDLYRAFHELQVLGRIYVAGEGINAQLSIPDFNLERLRHAIDDIIHFTHVPFNMAVEDDGQSFFRLTVKVRNKLVADGLDDTSFDVTNAGKHLTAEEFNQAMEDTDTVVIDMRNHYESEVGRFQGALCPQSSTFREVLPEALQMAAGYENKKILLYCTGGIRCEKASAYFRHHGFKHVYQLYGGIIRYAHEVKVRHLPSKFIGKNFVFDQRLGERITPHVIARCHQCGCPADTHVNCANLSCHLLFIQCEECARRMNGCCSVQCREFIALPEEIQRKHIRSRAVEEKRKNIYHPRMGRLTVT
jgi:UPF0176 protein